MFTDSDNNVNSLLIFLICLVAISLITGLVILLKQMTQKGRSFSKILLPSGIILLMGFCGFIIGLITNSNIALKIIYALSFMLCGFVIYFVIYQWYIKH